MLLIIIFLRLLVYSLKLVFFINEHLNQSFNMLVFTVLYSNPFSIGPYKSYDKFWKL